MTSIELEKKAQGLRTKTLNIRILKHLVQCNNMNVVYM